MGVETDRKILNKIEQWKKENGVLPAVLVLYGELLNIQLNAMSAIPAYASRLTKSEITDSLVQGIPLLKFDDLNIDWKIFDDIFKQVISILPQFTDASKGLSNKLENQVVSTNLKAASQLWFENCGRDARCCETQISDELSLVLSIVLRPFLIKNGESLAPLVEQDQWRKGYCPICGGLADFAFLDKERGARWLMCSRCDAQWLFKRLECSYCGSQDQNKMSYNTDDTEFYRIYVCEQCKCYLKTVDLRRAEGEILLPLERMVTPDLDEQAYKKGYLAHPKAKMTI